VAGLDIRTRTVASGHSRVWTAGRGFTMVELIVVMVLIGVLGAIGLSRFFDRRAFDASAAAEQSLAMLRYAQKLAIAQRRDVFVRFDGTNMRLCYAAACAPNDLVLMPGGGTGVSPSPYTGAVNLLYFDGLGRPFNAGNRAALPNLTFKAAGSTGAPDIYVAAETGYVSSSS